MFLPTPKEMRPGGPLDLRTLNGCVRCFFLGWICFLGMWYSTEIGMFIDRMLGVVSDPPNIGKISFRKLMAFLLGGGTIITSLFIGIALFVKQKHAQKTDRGQ